MSVVSRMEDGVFDHAIDLNRFEEGMKRRSLGFLKEMSDDINRLLSDSPTQMQADRLSALLDQVDNVIADAHSSAKTDMRNQLLDFAPIEEKATTKIMNDSVQADIFSPKMTAGQLQAVVDDSLVRGALGSKWWDRLEENTKNKITKGIQLGIAEGESMSQIKTRLLGKTTGQFETYEVGGKTKRRMKRIGGWMQASNREAEAVIRTSVHNVASNVRDKTYLNNLDVIEEVESVATLDGRTTPLCASYDGLRWTADGHRAVGGHGKVYRSTPRHWNCRSTHVPVLGELDKLDAIAKSKGIKIPPASRASITGKQRATMNMDKWLRKQGNEMQDKIVGGKTKGNLFRKKPKMTLKDFTNRRGDPLSIQELRDKFGAEFLQITRTAVVKGLPESPFLNSAFVDTKLPNKKAYIGKAVVDAEREFTGLVRSRVKASGSEAYYMPSTGDVHMSTNAYHDATHRHGRGTFSHEYGHHMDHALGRKVLYSRKGVYTTDTTPHRLVREVPTAYGRNRWTGTKRLSDTNVFEEAREMDEKNFLKSGGYLPNARGNDDLASNRRRRSQLLDNQLKADMEIAEGWEYEIGERDTGRTMRQMNEARYKRLGLSVEDVEDVLNKDTDWEGIWGTATFDESGKIRQGGGIGWESKLAKIGQALEDRDAGHLMDELSNPTDWDSRQRTYLKGMVPYFSDLIGSASKNRLCGLSKRHGYYGHKTKYYNDRGGANTETFANLTSLMSQNDPFWDKTLEIFTPNLVKAYEDLLDASNKTEWESDNSRQRKFIKPKKEIEVEL